MTRYAGQRAQHIIQRTAHRKSIDPYDLGMDYPFPDKDIEQLTAIAELITQQQGQPLTYENVRRNGIEYMDAQIQLQITGDSPAAASRKAADEDDSDLMEF